jgi:hypothetical protein
MHGLGIAPNGRDKIRRGKRASIFVEGRLQTSAKFSFDPGAAGCTISFDGLQTESIETHGIDALHALAQAIDIDTYLRGMGKQYDFYWATGEPYFDE